MRKPRKLSHRSLDEDTDEADEEETAEEETETAAEPEKKKKRGFFSRLFGGKDND